MSDIIKPSYEKLPPGYEVRKFPDNSIRVLVHVEKGENKTYLLTDTPVTMFRFRLPILTEGALNKYITFNDDLLKETIEQIDIELELVERFFLLKHTREWVRTVFRPVYDTVDAEPVGKRIGAFEFSYPDFYRLLAYLKYLSYEPIVDDRKDHLF